jgi:putative tryptophan/tyrosine transport system ATP-binding protein
MIQIEQLHKYFNRNEGHEIHALRGIDLSVGAGEFVTLIGSNGAGKSTLLHCIAGTLPADSGRVLLDRRDVTMLDASRRAAWIGRVFQNPLDGTAGNLSIEQNLALALLRGKPKGLRRGVSGERRQLFQTALAPLGLGLETRMSTPVRLLSGGQRQALALLMATLVPPQLLLLDEHTAALDPGAAGLVANLTARLVAGQGLTALMITHNMQQALNLGTRTLMLHQGQIILDISGAERAGLTVQDLVRRFTAARESAIADDELLLSE